jgi:prolipoprotein diacylglyceryltransferase
MHKVKDIAFRIGWIPVHLYGILIATGVLSAIGIALIEVMEIYHPCYEYVSNISPTKGFRSVSIPYPLCYWSLHPGRS